MPAKLQNRSSAGVAQSVEQLICNQQVTGSIPVAGTNKINKLCKY